MKKTTFIFMFFFIIITSSCKKNKIQIEQRKELKEFSEASRMDWWEEARFGMFIHWGIYSVPAGFYKGEAQTNSAEWIMNKGKIPISEYEKFADDFNPTKFNAEAFVLLAKNAGMKYMVITAKHHDGFSMFDSKASAYNIVDATPFKRDVLKELAAACQEQGIKFGFYYSQAQDWHHPGGMGNNWDNTIKRVSNDTYVYEKALPEVKQLLTEYGDIAIFWWDTPRKMTKEVVDSLYHITTALQPKIITNDRLGADYPGDHKTFERHGPRFQPESKFWELCQPVSGSWGYRRDDDKFKSTSVLIHNLIDQSSKGGNYLLNVSPTQEGTLKDEAIDRLKAIGAWMRVNSESIYGTEASPCTAPDWGRITMKTIDNKAVIYLHVYHWEEDTALPIRLNNEVEACYLLADKNRTFETTSLDEGIQVELKGNAPDSIASVIVLKLKSKPNALPQKPLGQNNKGVITLAAYRAQYENLQGPGAQYDERKDCVSAWESTTARVYWNFLVDKPGVFNINAEFAGKESAEITISLNGVSKNIIIPRTGNSKKFETVKLGRFEIEKVGDYEISIMPVANKWHAVNMKNVVLQPEKKK